MRETIATNGFSADPGRGFEVRRDLAATIARLGPAFAADLEALRPEHHVLDAGAGELRLVRDYLERRPAGASVTAVTFRAAPESVAEVARHPRTHVLTGRLFEDISNAELLGEHGPFHLILDVYGVFSYATAKSETLNRYLELLAPGGRIHLAMGKNEVTPADAPALPLGHWLALRPELQVSAHWAHDRLSISPRWPGARVPNLELVGEAPKVELPRVLLFRDPGPLPRSTDLAASPPRLHFPAERCLLWFEPRGSEVRLAVLPTWRGAPRLQELAFGAERHLRFSVRGERVLSNQTSFARRAPWRPSAPETTRDDEEPALELMTLGSRLYLDGVAVDLPGARGLEPEGAQVQPSAAGVKCPPASIA